MNETRVEEGYVLMFIITDKKMGQVYIDCAVEWEYENAINPPKVNSLFSLPLTYIYSGRIVETKREAIKHTN
jgi:hypothetical protein